MSVFLKCCRCLQYRTPRYQSNLLLLREYGSQKRGNFLKVRDDIAEAATNRNPVVALESTIITHGMPYPDNFKTAIQVEDIIKQHGALPATIGIIDGELIVGLNEDEIRYLAENKEKALKTSRRDLSYVLNKKLSGSTTVSATMVAANMIGIEVFVTGGIGGVHRGAEASFDISADLTELSRTPVAVVCSGVKSILDIGLTLEYLETQGVPVLNYGPTRWFPAFFTPQSKFQAPYNSLSITEIARIIFTQFSLKLRNGMVIAVPIPEDNSILGEEIELAIQQALSKAESNGISGKDVTPFVLSEVVQLTGGNSLKANIKLIENNAKVGAQISVALAEQKIEIDTGKPLSFWNGNKCTGNNSKPNIDKKRPVVIGGSIFDIKATIDSLVSIPDATNFGKVHTSFGGVGRNIAECLQRLGVNPLLISSIGKDYQGKMLLDYMKKLGMDVSAISITDLHTASYSAVADNSGELIMAVGDMESHEEVTSDIIYKLEEYVKNASILILDGNIPESSIFTSLQLSLRHDVPVWFEPTSVNKATKPFLGNDQFRITYVSPNFHELQAMHRVIAPEKKMSQILDITSIDRNELIDECLRLSEDSMEFIDNFLITLGKHGILFVSKKHGSETFSRTLEKTGNERKTAFYYPPAPHKLLPITVTSVSGAGDSFAAGVIYGLQQRYDVDTCLKGGLLAAHKSLLTYTAISEDLNPQTLTRENINNWAAFNSEVIKT